jgi:hypothetical protein
MQVSGKIGGQVRGNPKVEGREQSRDKFHRAGQSKVHIKIGWRWQFVAQCRAVQRAESRVGQTRARQRPEVRAVKELVVMLNGRAEGSVLGRAEALMREDKAQCKG